MTSDETLLAPSVERLEPAACHQTIGVVGAKVGDDVVGRGKGGRVGARVGSGVGPVGMGVGWKVDCAQSQL